MDLTYRYKETINLYYSKDHYAPHARAEAVHRGTGRYARHLDTYLFCNILQTRERHSIKKEAAGWIYELSEPRQTHTCSLLVTLKLVS